MGTAYGHIKKDAWISPAWDSGQEIPPFELKKKRRQASLVPLLFLECANMAL